MMAADGSRAMRWSHGIASVLVVVASLWFAFAAAWGLFGLLPAGHLGAGSAGNAMAAEQMLRWKILYPAWNWYENAAPPKGAYICHHPFGQYYSQAIFLWIFGHRDFVVRLPAVLMSAAMPPLLYGIARERWGVVSGAVAAVAYSVIPIALGFSSFTNLETVCIFGALLFFWGHSRHMATGRRGFAVASLAGLLVTCSGDWVGYVILAPALAWFFLRGFVFSVRLTPRFRFEPYARWWAFAVALATASAMLWMALFFRADAIQGWVEQATVRGGAETTKLHDVLEARKNWIDFCFTPLAIRLGRVAAPVCLLRLLLFRRDEEIYSLALLFGATFQYVAFKQGADVHIFWPHYFAPYYALALAQLSHLVASAVAWLVARWAPSSRAPVVAWVGLTLGILPSVAMARDGVKSLWVWRETGGRYDDNGSTIRSNVDFLEVIRQVMLRKAPLRSRVAAHPSAGWGWEQEWAMQGNADSVGPPTPGKGSDHIFWVGRGTGLRSSEQQKFSSEAHVRVYGDLWVVDQRERAAPLDAFSMNEREPNPWEWLWFNPTERVRRVGDRPDPWLTWEWRTHLGQEVSEPTGEPTTIDEERIAHNAAVARGDSSGAERWRERIEAQLNRTVVARFGDNLRLIGVRVVEGVEPRLETWFEASHPLAGDASFSVRSTIVDRARWSLIPAAKVDRQMVSVSPIPTKLWRRGFLYKVETVLDHRIGREQYLGVWTSLDGTPAPARSDGRPETLVADRE
jgi:4-amino-4-deoxy-L-arabinose transferase-like glycosyltransferase